MPNRPTSEVRFRIGDVFPADDIVARFLTGLALSANDLIRVQSYVVREQDGAKQLFLLRQNACYVWGTALFVRDGRRLELVESFVASLSETARDHLDRATEGILSPGQSDFGRDLAFIRNHAFHYPELHPERLDRDALHSALTGVANEESSISGAVVEDFRFDFADAVAVRLLSRDGGFVVEELADLVAEFPIRTEAFRMFMDEAVAAYLGAPDRRRHLR